MKSIEEQNEAGLVVCACIGVAMFMLCVFAPKAHSSEPSMNYELTQGGLDPRLRSLDTVSRIEDIPEGKCMYVDIKPPVDRVVYPKRVLVCNTLNVVGIVDYKL